MRSQRVKKGMRLMARRPEHLAVTDVAPGQHPDVVALWRWHAATLERIAAEVEAHWPTTAKELRLVAFGIGRSLRSLD